MQLRLASSSDASNGNEVKRIDPTRRASAPAYGTYGFGVVALGNLERALRKLGGEETGTEATI